jgi:hypothetical protein
MARDWTSWTGPVHWRGRPPLAQILADQTLYFLFVDRFSDGKEWSRNRRHRELYGAELARVLAAEGFHVEDSNRAWR